MTDQQMRVSIAEACGWTKVLDIPHWGLYGINDDTEQKVPDYLNDLNAMYEVEEWINEDEDRGYKYDMALCKVVNAYEGVPCNHMRLYHASARQRAEAFLRMIDKWKE